MNRDPQAAWSTSDRRSRLPSNWQSDIRPRVLARDNHRCRWVEQGQRCTATATDVDHIRPGDDHGDSNLQSLCAEHHQRKTTAEAQAARARLRQLRDRPQPPHPGLRSQA